MQRKNFPKINIELNQLPPVDFDPGPPVLIVGMHNSGTSILAEIIHECGIFLCPDMGHYECQYFSLFLHDDLLLGSQSKWSQLPLMPVDEVLALEPKVSGLIKNQWVADFIRAGWDGESPWGFKDPRVCIFLPLYLKLYPQAKVVHIVRDSKDVAASLTRRAKQGVGIKTSFESWKELTDAYQQRCNEFVPQFENVFELTYEELCSNAKGVVPSILEFLNLPPDSATPELLGKLSPKRIGSYDKYVEGGWRVKVKNSLSSLAYRFLKPENSGK